MQMRKLLQISPTVNTRRQVAELYALGLVYTPRLGPATDSAVTKLAAVFTQVGVDLPTCNLLKWVC